MIVSFMQIFMSILVLHSAVLPTIGQQCNGKESLLDNVKEGKTSIVKCLLEMDYETEVKDSDGKTPLMIAAEKGYYRIAKLLVNKKAKS